MKWMFAAMYSLAFAMCALAQSDRGVITGLVNDPVAAVVPGAKVVARNVATGTTQEAATTETGNYTLSSLPAGMYELKVEVPGFKVATIREVQVQVAQTTRVDVTLEVGATSEVIEVTASAPLLRTENAEQSATISGERFNALPLNFGGGGGSIGAIRSWLSFITLAPGVSGTGSNAAVNGMPGGAFKIYLEGQDVTSSNDTVWTSTVASASVETIGEFTMQTANFQAEFGQVLGGLFNFTTKSGTNQLHGSAYDYMTNEAFDARQHFRDPNLFPKPRSRKHDFGFTVGGPVYLPKLYDGRNKTFFFFNLEMYRNTTRSAGTPGTVPTAAYRAGNFATAGTGRVLGTDVLGRPILENAIYDPLTERVENGQIVRDLFPNATIPASRLDPVAQKVQALIPAPMNNDLINNWIPDIENYMNQAIPAVKIDHNFTDMARISGYWSVQKTDKNTGEDGLPTPITARRDQKIYGHTTRLNYDHSLTPTLLLRLGAGYVRFHNPDSSPAEVLRYDVANGIGFKGSATGVGFPYIGSMNTNTGGFGNQIGPNTAGQYYNDKATGVVSVAYVRNNHTYKLGAEFKQEVWTDNNYYQSQGHLNFGRSQTALPYLQSTTVGAGSIGYPYASFLMGLVNDATVTAPRTLQWRKKAWGLYVQDTWKITRNLTLDYGLRWDYTGQGHELHYRTSQVGVNTPNPVAGGLPGGIVYEGYGPGRCNCDFVKAYPYAVGPRLGLAYQLNPKTVVRAGWGVTYSAGANWWYVTGGSSSLGVGFNSLSWASPAFGDAAILLNNGLQYNPADLYVASYDPGIVPRAGQLNVPPAWGAQINDPNGGRPARVNQWNISVQRELARNTSLEIAWVGNRGVWLEANNLVNMNAINPATLRARGLDIQDPADQALLRARIDSPLAISNGFTPPYAGFPGSATVAQSLRPFPMYNDRLALRWAPLGNNWYDSLQVKFTKRYSRGLDLTAAFTWQKELALGSGGNPGASGGTFNTTNNIFNRKVQKSLTATSQPLILVTGFTYDTPQLTSSNVVRKLTGNWRFSGILRISSGSLIPVAASRNNLGQLIYQDTRFNRVSGEPLFIKSPNSGSIDPNKELVLNPKAWSDAAQGEWGTAAPYYNDFRWQRSITEQASIGRRFSVREKMSLEFRAEFFNIFNRTILPAPASTNPTATPTYNAQGIPTGGFGYINALSTGGQRNGQVVARFEF
jgi:hypothetical protein